jgi:hypothetical protein
MSPQTSARFACVGSWTLIEVLSAWRSVVDCGHEVPIDAPHELAALIEAFLAGLGEHGGRQRARRTWMSGVA